MPARELLVDADAINRLVNHDVTLFAADEETQQSVRGRLGWTALAEPGRQLLPALVRMLAGERVLLVLTFRESTNLAAAYGIGTIAAVWFIERLAAFPAA